MDNNALELGRVSVRIGSTITEFFNERLKADQPVFYMESLRRYVAQKTGDVAPGSPDRVMRDLRQRGSVKYSLVSRRMSLYRAEEVAVTA